MIASSRVVLVVDDDVEIRETLTQLLQQEGYTVLRAANGVQALAQLRDAHPDVMLLDLMMPVMSGWEVLEELDETGELGNCPIIVISAMSAPSGCACLCKPVKLDELLAAVGSCCRGPGRAQEAPAHP